MIGSQTFQASDAPKYVFRSPISSPPPLPTRTDLARRVSVSSPSRYLVGLTVTSAFFGVEFVILGAWWMYYLYENRRRDRAQIAAGVSDEERIRLSKVRPLFPPSSS